MMSRGSDLEERVAFLIRAQRLPVPVRELVFAPPRRFRFDFCWPDRGLALEVQGGVFVQGAHSRGVGLADDCDKLNLAALRGWRVFQVTARQIRDGSVTTLLDQIFATEIRYVNEWLTERTSA